MHIYILKDKEIILIPRINKDTSILDAADTEVKYFSTWFIDWLKYRITIQTNNSHNSNVDGVKEVLGC